MEAANAETLQKSDRLIRKKLLCPVCGWRLMDACGPNAYRAATQRQILGKQQRADFAIKCQRCKNEIIICID